MGAFVIIAGLAFCFGSIFVPLRFVDRLGPKRLRAHGAVPIIGYVLGVCGLIVIIGAVEGKISPAKDRQAGLHGATFAENLCRELTFHGWTRWRSCEPSAP